MKETLEKIKGKIRLDSRYVLPGIVVGALLVIILIWALVARVFIPGNRYNGAQALLALFHAGTTAYIACMAGSIYLALFDGIIRHKVSGDGAVYTIMGLAYPSFLFGLLMMISVSPKWLEGLTLACLSTWVCDSFALFGGKRFGKHRVAPSVSPNKTVEGCICGFVSALVTGVVIYYIPGLCRGIPPPLCISPQLECAAPVYLFRRVVCIVR